MRRALNAEQTRALESEVMRAHDLTLRGLMDLVGQAVADEAEKMAATGRIIIVTGTGNNAGDGWDAARVLHERGRDVVVAIVGDPDSLPEVASAAFADARHARVDEVICAEAADLERVLAGAGLIVDAMFGFGLRGALRVPYAECAEIINASGIGVLSIDLPSGVEADTGQVQGEAVRATRTLAVLCSKVGHVQEPGRSRTGELVVAVLGLDIDTYLPREGLEVWVEGDVKDVLLPVDPQAHKGSTGRVLVIGGSAGMAGSISLSAWGALRTGAGYVTVACPASLTDSVNAVVPSAVAVGLPESKHGSLARGAIEVAFELAGRADVIVVGPGIGPDEEARAVALALIAAVDRPAVVDADALNALASSGEVLDHRGAATVLTPHPGETARLLGISTEAVQMDRLGAGSALAALGAVAVLKGAGTIVTGSGRASVITTGGPALATLGTGDVLAGMIGAILARGADAFEAATAAAYLHGLAGDLAAADLTDDGVTSWDLPTYVPTALKAVSLASS